MLPTPRPPRRRAGVLAIALATLLTLAACDASAPGGDAEGTSGSAASTAVSSSTTTAPAVSELAVSTLPPEPTGVPGIDADDEFCGAWARYGGSVQVIAIAGAFGGLTSTEVARIEAFAASTIAGAVDAIGQEWPAELVSERSVVLADVLGPYQRRAQRMVQALRDAGATDEDLAQLTGLWVEALRSHDNNTPDVALPVLAADLAAVVDAASAAFAAAVTPFSDDPSLQTAVADTPLTDQLLAERCPDLASIGVGDAI